MSEVKEMKKLAESTAYHIKNLKTGPSSEYGPNGSYTCTLYRDKKRVATVFEAGDSGPINFEWLDSTSRRANENTPERKLYLEEVKKHTYHTEYNDGTAIHSEETFVGPLVANFEYKAILKKEEAKLKRLCKTKTVFKLKSQSEDQYMTCNRPYGLVIYTFLHNKYGDDIEVIYNERYPNTK